jgi:putative phosphonate metabolism protein
MRYAIYYAPEDRTPLAAFGTRWLGRDARGERVQPIAVAGFTAEEVAALTAAPRRYGFHATLKAPFALAPGRSLASLVSRLEHFTCLRPPVEIPRLRLARIDGFLALTPSGPSPALDNLAADCVRAFDSWRALPGSDELARRRRVGLTPRQDELLCRWGYPFVLDEFRFHLTLTERLDDGTASRLEPRLQQLTAELTRAPVPLSSLCIFAEPAPNTQLTLVSRASLAPR